MAHLIAKWHLDVNGMIQARDLSLSLKSFPNIAGSHYVQLKSLLSYCKSNKCASLTTSHSFLSMNLWEVDRELEREQGQGYHINSPG